MVNVKTHTRKTKTGRSIVVKDHSRKKSSSVKEKVMMGVIGGASLLGVAYVGQPMMALMLSEATFAEAVPLFFSTVFPRIFIGGIVGSLGVSSIAFVAEKVEDIQPHNIKEVFKKHTPKNTFVILSQINNKKSLLWTRDGKNKPATLVFASRKLADEHAKNWKKNPALKGKTTKTEVFSIETFTEMVKLHKIEK